MRVKEFSKVRIGHAFRERLVHVPNGGVLVVQPKNISAEGLVSFGKDEPLRTNISGPKHLNQGDVLVVSRGRFAATVFNFPETDTWIAPSSILILSINAESVLPEYVACYFNSIQGQRMFQRHLEQTTVPFISTKNLAAMDIPVPSLDRQKALIAFEHNTMKYARLTSRKQELHKQIISHQLRPQMTLQAGETND